jgi:hypothetical protein
MNRRPNNLNGRIVKLEAVCRRPPRDSRFFMIWGRDDADLGRKLSDAKNGGDLVPGDRFDTKVWTHSSEPPSPRWTRLDEMGDDELTVITGGEDREDKNLPPSVSDQWTDAELSDFYAGSLPRVA